jgi:single-strand DNA-binding protein
VYAEGTPEVRTYQTNDGKSGASLSLRVQTVQLLGARGEGANTQQPERTYSNSNGNSYSGQNSHAGHHDDINEPADDLPF